MTWKLAVAVAFWRGGDWWIVKRRGRWWYTYRLIRSPLTTPLTPHEARVGMVEHHTLFDWRDRP